MQVEITESEEDRERRLRVLAEHDPDLEVGFCVFHERLGLKRRIKGSDVFVYECGPKPTNSPDRITRTVGIREGHRSGTV